MNKPRLACHLQQKQQGREDPAEAFRGGDICDVKLFKTIYQTPLCYSISSGEEPHEKQGRAARPLQVNVSSKGASAA